MSKVYVCIAPSKEQFDNYDNYLGESGERALYYHTDIGRNRIYREEYPICSIKKLKLLKYKSLKYAQQVCDVINNAYGDNFKPLLEGDSSNE